MKVIRNLKPKPLKVPVPGGKFLHLGPQKTGQISDKAAGSDAVRKLVKEGEIEIVGEEGHAEEGHEGAGAHVHSSTHGHPQPTVVLPKGNR